MVSWTKSAGPARNHGAMSRPVRAPVATARRAPKGRQTRSTGSSRARCCLLAQARASGTTAHQALPRSTRTAHQTMPASSNGSVHAWSTWVSVPGAKNTRASTAAPRHAAPGPVCGEPTGRCLGPLGDAAPPVPAATALGVGPDKRGRPRAVGQRPHADSSDQTPHQQRPADVAGQPPAGRQQHGRPGQVGEGVLDAGRPGPGHLVEALAAGEGVARLLQGDPDVDLRRGIGHDGGGRCRGIRQCCHGCGHESRALPAGPQQRGREERGRHEQRGGDGQPVGVQVAEERDRQGRQRAPGKGGAHHGGSQGHPGAAPLPDREGQRARGQDRDDRHAEPHDAPLEGGEVREPGHRERDGLARAGLGWHASTLEVVSGQEYRASTWSWKSFMTRFRLSFSEGVR